MPSPDRTPAVVAHLQAAFGARPFTRAQALRSGLTPARFRKAAERGVLHQVHLGVYVVGEAMAAADERERALLPIRAGLLAVPGSVAALTSAVTVHGGPAPAPSPGVHLIRPGVRYRREGNLHVHGSPLPSSHTVRVDGIDVTSLSRTAIDIGRRFSLPRALIVVDDVLRRGVAALAGDAADLRYAVHDPDFRDAARTPLIAALGELGGWQGIVRARRAVESGDPAAESALESLSRGTWPGFGIPSPVCGMPLRGSDGLTYWADQAWPDLGVLGECDGLVKYTDPERLRAEKIRQEALEQAGWIVVRWTWEEIVRRPHVVAARLQAAFERARRLRAAS